MSVTSVQMLAVFMAEGLGQGVCHQTSMEFNYLEVVMPLCTVQRVKSEFIVGVKVLQNMHWVKVLKEELLLVITQIIKMAVTEAANCTTGGWPNKESPSSKDVLSIWMF